jgi:hypothetical protein
LWKLQKEMNWALNKSLYVVHKDTRTIWQKRIDALKGKISDIRVRVGERIGGDTLHDNCGY